MDTVTIALTLPVRGTAYDHQAAIVDALYKSNGDTWRAMALGGLISTILAPSPVWPWNRPPGMRVDQQDTRS